MMLYKSLLLLLCLIDFRLKLLVSGFFLNEKGYKVSTLQPFFIFKGSLFNGHEPDHLEYYLSI